MPRYQHAFCIPENADKSMCLCTQALSGAGDLILKIVCMSSAGSWHLYLILVNYLKLKRLVTLQFAGAILERCPNQLPHRFIHMPVFDHEKCFNVLPCGFMFDVEGRPKKNGDVSRV